MSYILEALKKSDKERQREEIPDLQADHSSFHGKRQRRNAPLLVLLGAVVLVSGSFAALVWYPFFAAPVPQLRGDSKVAPAPLPVVQQLESAPPAIVDQPLEPLTEEVGAPAEETVTEELGSEIAMTAVPEVVSSSFGLDAVDISFLEELPAEVRHEIPALSFAGHVYAGDADKRLIIINNRIVREGDLISDGLSLEQIGSDSVVLRYQTALFRVQLF